MTLQDITLGRINRELRQAVSGQGLNFCSAVAMALDENLSVTARYAPGLFSDRFVKLSETLEPVETEDRRQYYYGVSPLVDSAAIIEGITKGRFTTKAGIDAFLREHHGLFMLHADQREYLLALARYIVIALAGVYAVRLRADEALLRLVEKADPDGLSFRRGGGTIAVLGSATEEQLELLRDVRFERDDDGLWRRADREGRSLRELMSDPVNITLAGGHVFYSGVLLKPLKLEYLKNHYENHGTSTLEICFERTTYATVYALDGNYTKHPLLAEDSRAKMVELLRRDDEEKRRLAAELPEADRREDREAVLGVVNGYLRRCFNVNQIGVSGNVISRDNILLLGKRNAGSIDSGRLYPSVNGNAEVADSGVAFYHYSVYEDVPTIALDEHRIDFLGEIQREAYAELRLDLNKQDWICYGLVISGDLPPEDGGGDGYDRPSRRMHFNVIFEQRTGEDFKTVCKRSRMAAESFENENMLGLEVECCGSRLDYGKRRLVELFRGIVGSKDVVESLLLIAMLFVQRSMSDASDVTSVVSLLMAALILVSTAYDLTGRLGEYLRRRRLVKKLRLFAGDPCGTIEGKLRRAIDGYSYHPVTYAAIKLFVESSVRDALL